MENKKLESIVHNVEHYFGFIYDKGFKIRYSDYSPQFFGNWVVEFESSNSAIYITSDRSFIILEFSSTRKTTTKDRIAIENLIYFISDGKNVVSPFKGNLAWGKKKQFERLANLLKEYVDQIMFYFENTSKVS